MKRFMNARKIASEVIADFASPIKQKLEASLLDSYGLRTDRDDSACAFCAERLDLLDCSGTSRTMQCSACRHCELVVSHVVDRSIPLTEFHIIRGEGVGKRSLAERSLAEHLVDCLLRGQWPRPAAIVDFGIDSNAHFEAMIVAVTKGCSAYEFDRVLGEGKAITKLVRVYCVSGPLFTTAYDPQQEDELE